MKFTILGLNQQGLIALDLDLVDTHIVRYMIDFHSTGKMKKCEIEGKSFFWVHYQSVIDELPILYMKKQAVKRRLDKIGNCGLVEKHVDKTGQGTYTYFRFIESVLTRLLSSGNGGTNNGGGCLERRLPVAPKGNPKTLLLKETKKEPCLIFNPTCEKESDFDFKEHLFNLFWKAGLRKDGKKKAASAFNKLIRGKSEKSATEFTNMLIADIKRRIPLNAIGFDRLLPATYLNGERWEDESNIADGNGATGSGLSQKFLNGDW